MSLEQPYFQNEISNHLDSSCNGQKNAELKTPKTKISLLHELCSYTCILQCFKSKVIDFVR
jgi:hypothetical protein